ncbi:MAG TPA: tetratricopeptide repeat protein, partial [Steroidobacteraceae bacterium]
MSSQESLDSLQLVVSLANSGQLDAAEARARNIRDKDIAAEAWRLLGRANANLQRFVPAISAIETALEMFPGSPELRFERALILEQQESSDEALAEFEDLARGPHAFPRLLVQLARSLEFAGRAAEAEALVGQALERWPVDADLHAVLAELRWSRGAEEALTERLERAIEAHPSELKLRLVAADALRNAGFPERALALLEEGLRRAPGSAAFLTSIGVLLDSLGREPQALPYLLDAVARAPASVPARRNLVPTLLKCGRAREALAACDALVAKSPDDQLLVAWRAIALRALGDPEYARLLDYPRLVRTYRLRSHRPSGIEDFNAAFARELAGLHRHRRRPLSQSLRGGTQTERNLPASNPVIAEFFGMLDEPIRDYIARLGELDPRHPTARRVSAKGGYRISGSWSVD